MQDVGRGAVGVQDGQQAEQVFREAGGWVVVGGVNGDAPGGGDRSGVVVGESVVGEEALQGVGGIGQQRPVVDDRGAAVREVRGGLPEGEREVPEIVCQTSDLPGLLGGGWARS